MKKKNNELKKQYQTEFCDELYETIKYEEYSNNNTNTEIIYINKEQSIKLKKEKGTYINITFDNIYNIYIKEEIKKTLKKLTKYKTTNCLIIGLGNNEFVSDSFGIKTTNLITPKKNIKTFIPSLKSKTGIDSYDIIISLTKLIKPSLIIILDSLITRNENKLNSIQITDTGIIPGSGINKNKKSLNKKTLKTNVISLGIPTVLKINNNYYTPYYIDLNIKIISNIIAKTIMEVLSTKNINKHKIN